MEIERKWLTRGWPEGLEPGSVIRMEQGYIATRPTVRIRLETQGDQVRRVLCFKGKTGSDGLVLEVNQVDPGHPGAFFYAEVEFPDLETARSWRPGPLAAYLDQEVTGTPGESMAAYWERTRGMT